MNSFLWGLGLVLCLAMLLPLYRVVAGPTVFDRLTGLSLLSTKTLVLLILFGVITGHTENYVDIALTYGIIGFIGPLILAKYFEIGGKPTP